VPDSAPPQPRFSQLYKQGLFITLGVLTGVILLIGLYLARNVFMMFAVAGLLAYLLAGPIDWLSARFGRRRLFTIAVFIVFVILLLAVFSSFIPILAGESQDLITNLPEYARQLEDLFARLNAQYGVSESELKLSDYLSSLLQRLQDVSPDMLSKVLGYGKTVLSGTAVALTWMFIIPLMTLYLLLDAHKLRLQLMTLFPERLQPSIDQALTAINRTLGSYIYSRVVLAGFVWATYTLILMFAGVKYAFLLGILAFVGEFIPVVGNLIAFVPIALITLVTVPERFIWIALLMVVVQGIQNYVITPKVMSDSMDIHPLTVVLAMLIGGTLAGGMGLVLGVPAAAAIKAIWVVFRQHREELLGVNLSVVDLVKRNSDGDPANDPVI
jgi:predicted PurR-regulated permease PerM